jgi:transposase
VQLYTNGKPKKDIIEEYQLSKSIIDTWIKQNQQSGS